MATTRVTWPKSWTKWLSPNGSASKQAPSLFDAMENATLTQSSLRRAATF